MIEILGVELYTAKETAELLGVSIQTLRSYVRAGRLHPTTIKRVKYISKEQLTTFLASGQMGDKE